MGIRYAPIQQIIRFSICNVSNIGCAAPVWTVLVSWYPRRVIGLAYTWRSVYIHYLNLSSMHEDKQVIIN